MTLTTTGSTITVYSGTSAHNFSSYTYNDVNLIHNMGSSAGWTLPINGSNPSFNNLNLSYGSASDGMADIKFGTNITVTGTLTITGKSANIRSLVRSSVVATQRTLTAAAISFSNVTLQSIVGAGAANWNISSLPTLSGDLGNNSGITFTSPMTCYFKTSSTCNWSDSTKWFTTSGGSTPARVPLPQDTAIFDANSFTTTGITLTKDNNAHPIIDFTGVTNSPIITYSSVVANCQHGAGNFTASSGLNSSSTIYVNQYLVNHNVTHNWNNYTGNGYTQIATGSPTSQLNLGATNSPKTGIYHYAGILETNSNNLTLQSLQIQLSNTTGQINLGSSVITVGENVGSNAIYMASTPVFSANTAKLILNPQTSAPTAQRNIQIATHSSSSFINEIEINSPNTIIYGNTPKIGTLRLNTAGDTNGTQLQTGTTFTVNNLVTNATAGNLVKIITTTSGTQATINSSNNLALDYINLKDIKATGNIPFIAGANSTNSGNNTNWAFVDAALAAVRGGTSAGAATTTGTAVAGKKSAATSAGIATTTAIGYKYNINDILINAPVLTIALSEPLPIISAGASIAIPVDIIALSEPLPIVSAGASVDIPVDTIALSEPLPSISAGASVSAPVDNIALSEPLPAISSGKSVDTPVKNIALSEPLPSISAGASVSAPVKNIALTEPLPTVTTSTVVANIALTEPLPSISAGASVALPVRNISVTGLEPIVKTTIALYPPVKNFTVTTLYPELSIGAAIYPPVKNFTIGSGAGVYILEKIPTSGEPRPREHYEDSHKLQADGIVYLYQIIMDNGLTTIYLKQDNDVEWQGQSYEGTGVDLTGVGAYADDTLSRPKMAIFNPNGAYSYLVDQGLLEGATVVRYQVLKQHLDLDLPIFVRQQWKLSRVVSVKLNLITVELRDMLDGQVFTTPARMYIPPEFPTVSLS